MILEDATVFFYLDLSQRPSDLMSNIVTLHDWISKRVVVTLALDLIFVIIVSVPVAQGSACDNTNGGCAQVCVNRTGLVTCYCNPGYNLTNDGKTCSGILKLKYHYL